MSNVPGRCGYLDCERIATELVTWQMRVVGMRIGKPVTRAFCGIHGEHVADPHDVISVVSIPPEDRLSEEPK